MNNERGWPGCPPLFDVVIITIGFGLKLTLLCSEVKTMFSTVEKIKDISRFRKSLVTTLILH